MPEAQQRPYVHGIAIDRVAQTTIFSCGACGSRFEVNAGGYLHLFYDCPTCGERCGIHHAPGWSSEGLEAEEGSEAEEAKEQ